MLVVSCLKCGNGSYLVLEALKGSVGKGPGAGSCWRGLSGVLCRLQPTQPARVRPDAVGGRARRPLHRGPRQKDPPPARGVR